MDTPWLFLFLQAVPCSYRCRHCYFAPSASFKTVPMSRLLEYARPFVEARDAGGAGYGGLAIHLGDCSLNHPELPAWVAFLKEHEIDGCRGIPADGFARHKEEKWRPYLERLREAGTEDLDFTLYGKGETHDDFARRSGSYAAIHSLAHLWQELGGQTSWGLFAHKGNIAQLGEIRSEVLARYGSECPVRLWHFSGYGAAIEELRLEAGDLERLDPSIQQELESYLTEGRWVEQLLASDAPPFAANPPVMHVAVDPAGRACIPYTAAAAGHHGIPVGTLPTDSVSAFLSNWSRERESWRSRYPSIGELARRYGDKSGLRLHNQPSIIRKWASFIE